MNNMGARYQYQDLTVNSTTDLRDLEFGTGHCQELAAAYQQLEDCWFGNHQGPTDSSKSREVTRPAPKPEALAALRALQQHAGTSTSHAAASLETTFAVSTFEPDLHFTELLINNHEQQQQPLHIPAEALHNDVYHHNKPHRSPTHHSAGSSGAWQYPDSPWQRVPADRQTHRTVSQQCDEWSHLGPRLCVTGKQLVPDTESGVHFAQPFPLRTRLPIQTRHEGPQHATDNELEVTGIPIRPDTDVEGTSATEEIFAADGQCEEMFAVQWDAWEEELLDWGSPDPLETAITALPAQGLGQQSAAAQDVMQPDRKQGNVSLLRQWDGLQHAADRDVRAIQQGLPPVQPKLSLCHELTEMIMERWWCETVAPQLTPLVNQRLAAKQRQRRQQQQQAEVRQADVVPQVHSIESIPAPNSPDSQPDSQAEVQQQRDTADVDDDESLTSGGGTYVSNPGEAGARKVSYAGHDAQQAVPSLTTKQLLPAPPPAAPCLGQGVLTAQGYVSTELGSRRSTSIGTRFSAAGPVLPTSMPQHSYQHITAPSNSVSIMAPSMSYPGVGSQRLDTLQTAHSSNPTPFWASASLHPKHLKGVGATSLPARLQGTAGNSSSSHSSASNGVQLQGAGKLGGMPAATHAKHVSPQGPHSDDILLAGRQRMPSIGSSHLLGQQRTTSAQDIVMHTVSNSQQAGRQPLDRPLVGRHSAPVQYHSNIMQLPSMPRPAPARHTTKEARPAGTTIKLPRIKGLLQADPP